MALNSMYYPLYVSAAGILAYALPRRARYVWLLLCSYAIFFSDFSNLGKYLPALALLAAATLISYACALGMEAAKQNALRVLLLVTSLAGCLGMWLVCKFAGVFSTGAGFAFAAGGGLAAGGLSLLLPVSMSIYTLQTVSYTADVYRREVPAEKNLPRYALYCCFFPGLAAGPLNRAGSMLPQFRNPAKFAYSPVAGGLFRMLWGFFKKMVIADSIAAFTGNVFGQLAVHTGPEALLAVLLFMLQLYMDFSACADIAIGSASVLGFRFEENFPHPFAASRPGHFWNRWLYTLAAFLHDYVYAPIAGQGKAGRAVPAILAASLAGGLFFGASAGYLLFAGMNGLLAAAVFLVRPLLAQHLPKKVRRVLVVPGKLLFFLWLMASFAFFASSLFGFPAAQWFGTLGEGWLILRSGVFATRLAHSGLPPTTLIVLVAGTLLVLLLEALAAWKGSNVAEWMRRRKWFVRWPLYYLLIVCILVFGILEQPPFLLQQF